MKVPGAGIDAKDSVPDVTEAYVRNPYEGKKMLTRTETLDCINLLSAVLLADERVRSR